MKTIRLTVLCFGIVVIITGCQRPEPEAPVLIAPQDAAVFDTTKPILIWSASNPENEYLVKIDISEEGKDTSCIWKVKGADKDTSLVFPFENVEYATIKWCVGVEVDTGTLWSETRTFYIDTRKNVPTLISPADGAVFDSLAPTFVWSKENVNEYYLMVFKDSLWNNDTLLWDTLLDTTYTMSMSDFISADSGTYKWTVAVRDTASGELIYPSPRSLRIKEFNFPLDLDTTYYPYGLGYTWYYETHSWVHDNYPWDDYGNSCSVVTDSFWVYDTLVFKLNGDVYVKLWNNTINGNDLHPDTVTIPNDGGEFRIYYVGDSLLVKEEFEYAPEGDPPDVYEKWEYRLKGVGLLSSGSGWFGYEYSSGSSSKLLWFFNGKDTVYKAP